MECKQVEVEMPEGYKKDINVCTGIPMPRNIKGMTNKEDLIVISNYLDDLGISDPELYVFIHELNHIRHPEKSEYEIRKMSDRDYRMITGEETDTTCYFSFLNYIKKLESFD